MLAPPLICLPASSPRIVTGRRSSFGAGSLPATLVIGEIIDDGILLPVTIRGEVPGRAMRGSSRLEQP